MKRKMISLFVSALATSIAVTAHGATGSSGWFDVDTTDGYVVRLHGNGAWTADGRDVVEQFFVADQSQDLVKEPFGKTRGSNLFLGWKIGNANFDWTADNKNAIKNLIGDGKALFFNETNFASLMEGECAHIEEDGRKVIDLYAIWTKSLCVKFYDPTDSANTTTAVEYGQTSELQPAYLLDHMWWRWDEEDYGVWHKSGETVEVWPGQNLVGFEVLSRYRKIVDIVPDYTNIVVRSNDGSDLQPFGSQTIAHTLCIPVKGEMSKWGTVEFRCSVAEGVDATGVEPFDTSKITANIRKKYSNGTDGFFTEFIDKFPVEDRICLPPGEYVVGFSYDGGWHEVFPALGSFTLPTGATSYFDTVIKNVRFEPDGSSVNGDYQYEDGTLRLSASFDYISAYYFVGVDDLEEIIFEGDAPEVESGALDQVPSTCTVRVSRSSTGWGVGIPGTWKGLRIEYLEEDEPEGSPVEFTVVDGVLTHVELNGAMEVVIPDGVKSIGEWAFGGCSGFTDVTIPNSVTNIGDYAFSYSYELTHVTIGNSVMRIGDRAFESCYALESVTGLRDDMDVAATAFRGTPFDENRPFKLDVRNGILMGMQGICPAVLSVPDGVTAIDENAFSRWSYEIPDDGDPYSASWHSAVDALETVFVPASVEKIGLYAFGGCANLSRVEIANPDVMIDGGACVAWHPEERIFARRMERGVLRAVGNSRVRLRAGGHGVHHQLRRGRRDPHGAVNRLHGRRIHALRQHGRDQ